MRTGDRSPTAEEIAAAAADVDMSKSMRDLRAQLAESEAWLRKIREALGVKTNAHALALARGLRKVVTGP